MPEIAPRKPDRAFCSRVPIGQRAVMMTEDGANVELPARHALPEPFHVGG